MQEQSESATNGEVVNTALAIVLISNTTGVVIGWCAIGVALAIGSWTWVRGGRNALAALVVGGVVGFVLLGYESRPLGLLVIGAPLVVGLAAGRVRGVRLGPLALMVGCGLASLLWASLLLAAPNGEVSRGDPIQLALGLAFAAVLAAIFFVGGCAGAFLWGRVASE